MQEEAFRSRMQDRAVCPVELELVCCNKLSESPDGQPVVAMACVMDMRMLRFATSNEGCRIEHQQRSRCDRRDTYMI